MGKTSTWLMIWMGLVGGGCNFFTKDIGPYAINEVGFLGRDDEGNPASWMEICNRGTEDRPMKDWTLRAEFGGSQVVLHTFGEADILLPHRHNLIGPHNAIPDVEAAFTVPTVSSRVVLKLYDAHGTMVDAISYQKGHVPAGGVARRCNCVSPGVDDEDTLLLSQADLTPGERNFRGGCGASSTFESPSPADAGSGDAGSVDAGPGCHAGGCHSHYPVASSGRTWSYDLVGGTGTQVTTSQGAGSQSGEWKLHQETQYGSNSAVIDHIYTCDADALAEKEFTSVSNSAIGTITNHTTFTPAMEILRANMGVGATFSQSLSAHAEMQTPFGPQTRDVAISQTVTVEAEEDVAVGGGTFHAVRVKQVADVGGSAQEQTLWLVPGMGPVRINAPPPVFQPGTTPPNQVWEERSCQF